MAVNQLPFRDMAQANAQTASTGFAAAAGYFRSLPENAWHERTGCDKWDMETLAGHMLGEVVWFPNLTRGLTQGEAPYPNSLYDEMNTWPHDRMADRMEEAADELRAAVAAADEEQLQGLVDLGFARLPLWQATFISALEATLHGWDARAVREPAATLPTAAATLLAGGTVQFAPGIAHRRHLAGSEGVYLLQVGDGVGPITVTIANGDIKVEHGVVGTPDVTLHLTADQLVRLLTGRLKLNSSLDRDRIRLEGDADRAANLDRVFQGINNEE